MDNNLVTLDAFPLPALLTPAKDRRQTEQRQAARTKSTLSARLAYGGLTPGLVGCTVVDMSETGVRIETYVRLDNLPDLFTLEICGVYNRARKCWTKGREMGLEFIFEDSNVFDEL